MRLLVAEDERSLNRVITKRLKRRATALTAALTARTRSAISRWANLMP